MFRVTFIDVLDGKSKEALIIGADNALDAGYAFIDKHPAATLIEVHPIIGIELIVAQAA